MYNRAMLTWKDIARFWSRVSTRRKGAGCWEWQGSCNTFGYGTVPTQSGKCYCAHRVAAYLAELVDSPAAPKDRRGGGFILHQCDNPKCCNPAHMRIGTFSQNQKESYERERRTAPRGSNSANSKLTPEQVASIRATYAAGEVRQVDLAAQYGVCQRTISMIVRKETYK